MAVGRSERVCGFDDGREAGHRVLQRQDVTYEKPDAARLADWIVTVQRHLGMNRADLEGTLAQMKRRS